MQDCFNDVNVKSEIHAKISLSTDKNKGKKAASTISVRQRGGLPGIVLCRFLALPGLSTHPNPIAGNRINHVNVTIRILIHVDTFLREKEIQDRLINALHQSGIVAISSEWKIRSCIGQIDKIGSIIYFCAHFKEYIMPLPVRRGTRTNHDIARTTIIQFYLYRRNTRESSTNIIPIKLMRSPATDIVVTLIRI